MSKFPRLTRPPGWSGTRRSVELRSRASTERIGVFAAISAAPTVVTSRNAKTRQSGVNEKFTGRWIIHSRRIRGNRKVSAEATAPATLASISDSVPSIAARRGAPAPSAMRRAISVRRPCAIASRIDTTLAHATSARHASPTKTTARIPVTATPFPGFAMREPSLTNTAVWRPVVNRSCCAAITRASVETSPRVAPGARRPSMNSRIAEGDSASLGPRWSDSRSV